jgi:hypothetical protein
VGGSNVFVLASCVSDFGHSLLSFYTLPCCKRNLGSEVIILELGKANARLKENGDIQAQSLIEH